MRIRLLIVLSVLGLVASCGADSEAPSPTSVAPGSATSAPSPSTTASPTPSTTLEPAEVVRYFRFDRSGVYFVAGESEQRLSAEGTSTASHDGMGGVLYTELGEAGAPGLHWTRPGAAGPETLNYLRGWGAVLDGRPTAVGWTGAWSEDCPETTEPVHLVDLQSADERFLGCFGGEDAGISLTSGGGGLLVGISWLAVGTNGTDQRFHLYDTDGTEIEHPANPVAESCAPCDLDAQLSPDGSLLAYRLRPDAKWSKDLDELQRIDQLTYDEWWETTRDIPATIVVLDLERAEEVLSMSVPAAERLVDFDGRWLVTESCLSTDVEEHEPGHVCSSSVIDIEGGAPATSVEGSVRLANEDWGDPPTDDVFPPLLRIWSPVEGQVVDTETYTFHGIADPDAQVVAAARYPVTLQPNGVWSIVLLLRPGGNLATITATDAAGNVTTAKRAVTYQPALTLDDDGLSIAHFGDPADGVIEAVTELLGSPSRDVVEARPACYLSVEEARFVEWEALGLRLVFTDWGGSYEQPVATPLHFTDWEIIGPGLVTDDGLGWGSTVGELRAARPDVLIGINEYAPAFLDPSTPGRLMGGFDWPYDDFLRSLQLALNEHGADLEITGTWDGATEQALLDFLTQQGMHGAPDVLTALGLPAPDVRLGWMHAGQGPLCD